MKAGLTPEVGASGGRGQDWQLVEGAAALASGQARGRGW